LALALACLVALENKAISWAASHELVVQSVCGLIYFVSAVGSVVIIYSSGITFGRLYFLSRIFAESVPGSDRKILFLTRLKLLTSGVFTAASLGTIGSLSWSIAVIVPWNGAADTPGPVLVYVSLGSLIVHVMTIILLLCCHYAITYDLSPCVAER
jgi:hypothetical protein